MDNIVNKNKTGKKKSIMLKVRGSQMKETENVTSK
jgi:hypothetical protein